MIEAIEAIEDNNLNASNFAPTAIEVVRPEKVIRHASWSATRHVAYCCQAMRFALPLCLIDLFCTSTVLMLVTEAAIRLGAAVPIADRIAILAMQSISVVITFAIFQLYQSVGMHPVVELKRIVTATCMIYFPVLAITIIRYERFNPTEWSILIVTFSIACFLLPSVRHIARSLLGRTKWWSKPLIILGEGQAAQQLVSELRKERHLGWNCLGYVENADSRWTKGSVGQDYLGSENDLPHIASHKNVFWAVVDARNLDPVMEQKTIDRHASLIPNIVAVHSTRGGSNLFCSGLDCGGVAGIHQKHGISLLVPKTIKRCFDIAVSGLILLLLSPVLIAICVAIHLSNPGPIFYSQERIGFLGERFKIWKFRSMVTNSERYLKECLERDSALAAEFAANLKLKNDPRITSIGKLLRKTSLDEIPQLWNVLNGTMSLVGPRPMLLNEHNKYGEVYWLYTRTKPGITGLWQVNGRNLTSYEERLYYVSFYARNWSLWMDWYILLKTFRVVVLCEGAV